MWLPIVLSWLAVGALVAFALSVVALFGGLDTSGGAIDWVAVAAIAAVISALATVALGAGLVISAGQIEHERRDNRLPILRVDIGFEDWYNQPGFSAPESHVYDLSEIDPSFDAASVASASSGAATGGRGLVVWCTNQQTHQRGHAGRVRLVIGVQWTLPGGESAGAELNIELAYLSPKQTTAVRLFSARSDLRSMIARLDRVEYNDFRQRQRLTHVYSALVFVYDGRRIQNVRQLMPGEEV